MEQAFIEYIANALWQLPLLTAGAWLLLRITKPSPQMQHRVWLASLVLAVVLPLHGGSGKSVDTRPAWQTQTAPAATKTNALDASIAVGEPGLVLGPKIWGESESPKTVGDEVRFVTYAFNSRVHRIAVNAAVVNWIVGLYLSTLFIAFLRLMLAWIRTRRLLQHSWKADLTDPETVLAKECARRIGVPVPCIRESDAIAGPVVIGAVKPVLLWPARLGRLPQRSVVGSTDELKAALCHELAHIRRNDYLANLLCEVVSVPLKWHPVIYGVERRIRSTREMVCDAVAAAAMESETKYAECLLSLAERVVGVGNLPEGSFVGAGLFNGNALEERVMRLMSAKETTDTRVKIARGFVGAAAMMATAALAASFHLVPAMAQAQESIAQRSVLVIEPAPITTVAPVSPAAAPAVAPTRLAVHETTPSLASASTLDLITPSVRLAQVAPAPAPLSVPSPVAAPAPPAVVPQVAPLPEAANPDPAQNNSAPSVQLETDGKDQVVINGIDRKLTPEERQRIEKQLEEAQRQIATEKERLSSPEFRKQIADAQRQAIEASREIESGKMQRQLAEAQKEIAAQTARLNSPEFRKQIEDAQRHACEEIQQIDSAQLQKQMADAQRQVAASTEKLNSPEFRKQIEDAIRQSQQASRSVDSVQIQKQLDDAQKQIADQLEKMKVEDEDKTK
jgi:beta-lactamase regulating signal transducer with metallopeptidase domain